MTHSRSLSLEAKSGGWIDQIHLQSACIEVGEIDTMGIYPSEIALNKDFGNRFCVLQVDADFFEYSFAEGSQLFRGSHVRCFHGSSFF